VSRFLDRVQDASLDFTRPRDDWEHPERPFRVLTVTSNKGGVGKTTITANLAVYLRALREDLPILVLGFDDQTMLDRMLALRPGPAGQHVASALREGSFAPALRLGQYGLHYVPSCPDISEAKRLIRDPFHLQTILHRSAWRGLVILDTKSDFEILTRNAIAASDLTLVVVKDQASLLEAERVFEQLAAWGRPPERARVLLSMVNLRVKYRGQGKPDILALLVSEIRRRGYPLLESFLSSSPKVESLYTNPQATTLPVLSGARESVVHQQLHHLAHDVLKLLDATGLQPAQPSPAQASPLRNPSGLQNARIRAGGAARGPPRASPASRGTSRSREIQVPSYRYERLSAQDNSFLVGERPTTPMQVAGVQLFESGTLRTKEGGIDFALIRRGTEALLHRIPRYRQKLQWTPFFDHPVWVDDPDFHIDYHMRHTSLPRPGGIDQLKRMSARIMAQELDRARPLWELWVVEGLAGDRFATISKMHHCMIDGTSGVDLAQILLSPSPAFEIPDAPRFMPRPAPSATELLRDEMLRRASLPLRALRSYRAFRREAQDLRAELRMRVRAIRELMGWVIQPASETPINGDLTPHRRFDWLAMSLADVKAVRKAADCSVNDVVLTTVTGAVREYMRLRNVVPSDLDFRVSAPVSVRREAERGRLGNRVSSWILQLPLGEASPLARLRAIHDMTQRLKESKQALGVEMMMQIAEWTPPVLLSLGAQAASGPINSIVTNVPGPQFPLYMFGAKLVEMYPVVPLLEGMGLGIALFSYDGRIFWGFNADYALLPDLDPFVAFVRSAFEEFAAAVDVEVGTGAHEVRARVSDA
jgi:WS/DGAT/MGAT family acyltransferase